ncbi:MAG: anthranilate synthase component I family protein [Campylobacterales bacterium]|nr:anthranilate synthase component I family protein [Campylobacterales bacterium]
MIFHKKLFFDQITPVAVYEKLKKLYPKEITFLFESVVNNDSGNFSYITIGAKEKLVHEDDKSIYTDENGNTKEVDNNPLDFLKKYYKEKDQKKYKELSTDIGIDFIDGFIGYIGYESGQLFEPKLKKSFEKLKDETKTPDVFLVRPKLVLAYSHKNATLTLVTPDKAMEEQFGVIEKELFSSHLNMPLIKAEELEKGSFALSKDEFFNIVEKAKEEITKGEIFQILISNRFTQKAKVDNLSFYRVLRSKNPSPYLFLLDYNDFSIVGSSPEVMVGLKNGEILLRPIAGTRKRGKTHARDLELEAELLADEKEKSEHIMLVDLGRNDVGRVAKTGSVKVENLMHVERYSHVMHIVSDVTAKIREDKDMFDLMKATFTAGTMTGAPKVRAMELIARFEKTKRGFYSGTIAFFSFNGDMDSTITIRSSLIKDEEIIFHAGAGIVADSKNELEWLEIENKIAATVASYKDLLEL